LHLRPGNLRLIGIDQTAIRQSHLNLSRPRLVLECTFKLLAASIYPYRLVAAECRAFRLAVISKERPSALPGRRFCRYRPGCSRLSRWISQSFLNLRAQR
jgi:hypothetical protein